MGLGAIRDVNFNAITESNPTQPGAVLQGYMTGLGDTFPVLDDGAVAPTNPLVRVVSENGVAVGVDNRNAEVQFAGLTPTLAALYQVNFKVPDTVSAGDVFVDILTADAQSSQAITRVSTTSADAPRKAEEDRPFVRRR
jgi:uncharacterized protein (TIGR03437 family)